MVLSECPPTRVTGRQGREGHGRAMLTWITTGHYVFDRSLHKIGVIKLFLKTEYHKKLIDIYLHK